tara:strand:- start:720 stop:905 length:186 start_codon:yes stop_codon:yes gene_type:complete
MSINPKKITITLNVDQYNAIVSALTSADIWHMSFEESHLNEYEQKIWTQAFKKFGLDLSEG